MQVDKVDGLIQQCNCKLQSFIFFQQGDTLKTFFDDLHGLYLDKQGVHFAVCIIINLGIEKFGEKKQNFPPLNFLVRVIKEPRTVIPKLFLYVVIFTLVFINSLIPYGTLHKMLPD